MDIPELAGLDMQYVFIKKYNCIESLILGRSCDMGIACQEPPGGSDYTLRWPPGGSFLGILNLIE
jgi:hypothetical protein